MLNKLGVLKGGLNLTDGLNVNFERDKVFSNNRVMDNDGKIRAERAGTDQRHNPNSEVIDFRTWNKTDIFSSKDNKEKIYI